MLEIRSPIPPAIHRDLRKSKVLLTRDIELALLIAYQKGDKNAQTILVESNVRLVAKYAASVNGYGVLFEDLYQAGMIGFLRALDKFDTTKGFRLSTYAIPWIRQGIYREISNKSRTIRLPIHQIQDLKRVTDQCKSYIVLGLKPDYEKIAKDLDVDYDHVIEMLNIENRVLTEFKSDDGTFRSIDQCISDDETMPIEEYSIAEDSKLVLIELVQSLPEKQATILYYRFGLDGAGEQTLEWIGRLVGVTRERIRQLELKALQTLRKKMKAKGLVLSDML